MFEVVVAEKDLVCYIFKLELPLILIYFRKQYSQYWNLDQKFQFNKLKKAT